MFEFHCLRVAEVFFGGGDIGLPSVDYDETNSEKKCLECLTECVFRENMTWSLKRVKASPQ